MADDEQSYIVNEVNAADAEQIVGYQLFQIAKKLTSNELLILRSAYASRGNHLFMPNTSIPFKDWAEVLFGELGHRLQALIEHADDVLVGNKLLTRRFNMDSGFGGVVYPSNGRLTDLGIKFCESLERYEIAKKA